MRTVCTVVATVVTVGIVAACESPLDLHTHPTDPGYPSNFVETTSSSDSVEWINDEVAFMHEGNHYRARRHWDSQQRVAAIDVWINHVYETRLVADYPNDDPEISRYRVYDPVLADPSQGDPTSDAPWAEADRYDRLIRTSGDDASDPGDDPPGDPCNDQVDLDPWCEQGLGTEEEGDCEEHKDKAEDSLETANIGGGAGTLGSLFVKATRNISSQGVSRMDVFPWLSSGLPYGQVPLVYEKRARRSGT
jgi:hypothetical protein